MEFLVDFPCLSSGVAWKNKILMYKSTLNVADLQGIINYK